MVAFLSIFTGPSTIVQKVEKINMQVGTDRKSDMNRDKEEKKFRQWSVGAHLDRGRGGERWH